MSRPPRTVARTSIWIAALFALLVLAAVFASFAWLDAWLLAGRVSMEALHFAHLLRGIAAALLVGGVVALFLLRQRPTAAPVGEAADFGLLDRDARRREHLRWFVRVRWLAVAFTAALALIAVPLTDILPASTLPLLLAWCSMLAAANLVFARLLRTTIDPDRQAMAQVVGDLVVLTGLLNASGGMENPLYVVYLFHVIIGGILVSRRKVAAVAATAAALVSLLAIGELFGLLPHQTIALFPHRGAGEGEHLHGDVLIHAAHDPVFVSGRLVSFLGVLFLTAYFTNLVMERLRRSEANLERVARTALLEHRRLESVIDAAGVGMLVTDREGTVQWLNQRALAWLGDSDLRTESACPHRHDQDSCPACLALETAANGEPREAERTVGSPQGGMRHFRHATSPVRDPEGRVVQVVQLIEDVTTRKALQAEALHTGKLSVLGQLAAGVAHEIGNPLSSLSARLHLLRRRTSDAAFVADSLDLLQGQIDRIARIVQGVSHFARNRREERTTWEVNGVVEEALRLIQLDRRARGIAFEAHLGSALPQVRGVKDQLTQVLLNLLLNSVEAMPAGGRLEVTTGASDRGVTISVRDSGPGIDPAVRARIFEPFVTTKPDGTGLGLSISYSLIHAHGGVIEVDSEAGRGTVFRVHLPAVGRSATTTAPETRPS